MKENRVSYFATSRQKKAIVVKHKTLSHATGSPRGGMSPRNIAADM